MLRSLPLKRLKEYLSAYNIPVVGVKEKEGLVEAVVKARNPATGTLRPENESYYRRRSVPRHGRPPGASPRPPPQPQSQSNQARPPPPNYARPPPPSYAQPNSNPRPQARPAPQPSRPQARPASQPRPAPATRPSPPPPIPSILSLVALPTSYLSSLSIGTLKAILYENHVRVDFKQVLEKEELIGRVAELVADERRRLERQRREEEREAAEAAAAAAAAAAAGGATPGEGADSTEGASQPIPIPGDGDEAMEGDSPLRSPEAKSPPPPPTGPAPDIERGLCVVCQDEEATLAVVDCGHLAMCSRKYSCALAARHAQLAPPLSPRSTDTRLLRPHHGDEQGMSPVSHPHRHATAPHSHLPCLAG